jgi:hypothetical protein
MKRLLVIRHFVLILLAGLHWCGAARAEPTLTVELGWRTVDGDTRSEAFPAQDAGALAGEGLWLVFEASGANHVPAIYFGSKFLTASTAVEEMDSLSLRIAVTDTAASFSRSFTLFDKGSGVGFSGVLPQNVYHVLVFDGFADAPDAAVGDLPALEDSERAQAFARTRGLALNYLRQSDEKTRELAQVFDVQAHYDLPRLVLVAEQWIDLPEEEAVQEESSGGGLFGGLGAALEEKMEVVPKTIPTYTIDVIQNDISAAGTYAIGFQASRSWWNDVLGGAVIYQATGGKRRILTASTLFAQMQKNIAERQSTNHVLNVRADDVQLLDSCEKLWEPVKAEIAQFLADNPDWHVVIPSQPVTFYGDDDKPIYQTYAWFQVDPESGRMTGRLPRSGAVSNEVERLTGGLMDRAREAVTGAVGGAAKGFFSQIAGLYVGAAGIIDAVAMTVADPSLAAMDDQAWLEFVGLHALAQAQQFLEDHADQYDSYAAILGFWQGAMIWPTALGGREAARDAARRAWESVQEKAANDAKSYAKDKIEKAQEAGGEVVRETLDQYDPQLGELADGINAVYQGTDWGANAADAQQRLGAVLNELAQ